MAGLSGSNTQVFRLLFERSVQGIGVAVTKFAPITHHRKAVERTVCGQAQQAANTNQIKMAVGMLGHEAAVVGVKTLLACLLDVLPRGITKYRAIACLTQLHSNFAGDAIGADDEKATRLGFGHA